MLQLPWRGGAGQRVVVLVPLGVELDAPIEPLLPLEPLELGLVLLELPLAPMPDEPELPGEVLLLPLLPMLVEPPEPLLDGGVVVLPLVPAVLPPDLVPALSLPWPQAARPIVAAAMTASAAPRVKREAFIWNLLGCCLGSEGTWAAHGCLRPL